MGEHKKFESMTIGDILDYTFSVYRTYFLKLFLSGAFISLPFIVAWAVLMPQNSGSIFTRWNSSSNDLMTFIFIIAFVIFLLIYSPCVIKISSEIFMDRDISIVGAYKYSIKRVGSYFLTKLIAQLASWVMSLAVIVVGAMAIGILGIFGGGIERLLFGGSISFLAIILVIVFYLVILLFYFFTYGFSILVSTSFVVNENKYGDAVKEGFNVITFKFWRYCAACVAVSAIISIPIILFSSLGYGFYYITEYKYGGIQLLISMFGILLVMPVFFIMNTMFFYNYKIEKQGFGIEVEYNSLNENNFKEV